MKQLSPRKWSQWIVAAGLILAAAPVAGFALTDEEIFRDFRFNLSNPGARSLGLGGAFIAVADDATASLANPAGLMLLQRPEFFTEVRDTVVEDSSLEQQLSPTERIVSETFPDAVFSPSFLSYVYPFERFAVGVSRVELNKASNATSSTFLIQFDPNQIAPNQIGSRGAIRTDLSVWNVTGAVQILDTLSFGATVALGILDVESQVTNALVDTDPNLITFLTPQTIYETSINDNDTDVAFNAGIHWSPLETLSFGAVYRGGLEFVLAEEVFNDGFFGPGNPLATALDSPLDTTFNTPDSYGAGVAWQPIPALTLSADWVHIDYEDLLEGFESGLNILTFLDDEAEFTIEDADEIHFGAEYVFTTGSVPVAARVGAYTDHNSRIFADFEDPPFSTFSDNDSFPERDTETHITVGTGVVIQGKFQIDAAADFSDIVNEYVLSTIFRF